MKILFYCLAIMALGVYFFKPQTAEFYAREISVSCPVIMFSTSWCPVCKKAKDYFEKKDYPYCEYDIEKDATANHYYQKLNGRGVPTILIGNKVTVGLRPREIDKYMSELTL